MNQIQEILLKQRAEFVELLKPAMKDCVELQMQLDQRREQVRALKTSIEQIDVAVAAIQAGDAKRENAGRPKIMDVVLEILDDAPNGMTAREIMTEINTRNLLGEPIMRHSLSPQLSRLKDRDKKIDLRGDRWVRLPDEPGLFAPKE
ncbi:hypothetical protein [Tardiphaga sp. OK245]|uniref:hypothetical protein n=1 Tax=Tardiphaga sp. OK245 TaxID=1855306 RepID=UPI0008A80EBC|nr:hypothetical protein [Tardiphaga sp. OK245]SEH86626.1 hypothetical protein SAMN05216367_2426 [Tardiphaga sp. OK245]